MLDGWWPKISCHNKIIVNHKIMLIELLKLRNFKNVKLTIIIILKFVFLFVCSFILIKNKRHFGYWVLMVISRDLLACLPACHNFILKYVNIVRFVFFFLLNIISIVNGNGQNKTEHNDCIKMSIDVDSYRCFYDFRTKNPKMNIERRRWCI